MIQLALSSERWTSASHTMGYP